MDFVYNKKNIVKLLKYRGITDLKGKTIGEVIKETGGWPNPFEIFLFELKYLH